MRSLPVDEHVLALHQCERGLKGLSPAVDPNGLKVTLTSLPSRGRVPGGAGL